MFRELRFLANVGFLERWEFPKIGDSSIVP